MASAIQQVKRKKPHFLRTTTSICVYLFLLIGLKIKFCKIKTAKRNITNGGDSKVNIASFKTFFSRY